MNQPQPYMDVSQAHAPNAGVASSIAQYSYAQPQALQPASHTYGPGSYGGYSYPTQMAPMPAPHPVTSSMGGQMVPQALPLPTMGSNAPPPPPNQAQPYAQTFDTSGQQAPHGMKPRVTATLWEDEGSLCFQVEANGVCVARREDNHMINGTKLLNVAGMTRGRRDGILKSEKTRHVVKIGPMHLKGVWIPFDRALDFANKEKITDLLYPLFVHNIGALLYHPTNQPRPSVGNSAMAGRRPEQQQAQPQQPQSQDYMRPSQGNSYEYGAPHPGTMNQASTPPGTSHGMQYPPAQPYDHARPMYAAPAPFNGGPQYGAQPNMARYGGVQSSPGGVKNEMGPPARGGAEQDHVDAKAHDGYGGHPDADGEHEGEYTHTSASYPGSNASYNYKPNTTPGQMHSDPSHISPEMTHSPHQNGSGRATPRTTTTYTGYTTPQRATQLPSSNLNYVISNDPRAGGPPGPESYAPQAGYQTPQYPTMNGGAPPSNKRMREVDDQEDPYGRPLSAGGDPGLKRQRTDPSSRPISQPHSVKAGGARR